MVKTSMQSATGRQKQAQGFTLIEIMVAIAVVGILMAIAWPNYQDYLVKSRRAAGQADMLEIQLALEKWRANKASYRSDATPTSAGTATTNTIGTLNYTDNNAHYNFTITGTTGSAYIIKGDAQGVQATKDASCANLTINQSNTRGPAGCWKS